VAHLLGRAGVRLLTLTGPAGVGKTRLALQVAAGLRGRFTDGVFLITLAPLRDPNLIASTIAQTLGVIEVGGRPNLQGLVEALCPRQMLLLLDNFEHVAAAAPMLATLVQACPAVTALVTSRAALRVRGEQEVPVWPLALPDPGRPPAIAELRRCAAVQLFVQRAQAVQPDFALTAENAAAIAAICARLDGLPLALELAAARSKLLPPVTLLARLDRRLDVLTDGATDLPERQQTLRATLDWSYDLLDAAERALFRRLAAFVGGCSLEAAEAVCRDDDVPDVVAAAAALLDKSLLQRQDGPDGEPRLAMLETVREYAQERLMASGEAAKMQRRQAAYYLALAERAEPGLRGSQQALWLACLERDHDNLRAVLQWARELGDVDTGLRLAGALAPFWYVRAQNTEGRAWLEGLLAAASGGPPTAVRAKALHGLGALIYDQGDSGRAALVCEESLALYREMGHTEGIARVLTRLGGIARDARDHARAAPLLEESLALYRVLGDTAGIAHALVNLGVLAARQDDLERAVSLCTEGVRLYRTQQDAGGLAYALLMVGKSVGGQGDHAHAEALIEESLVLYRTIGDRGGISAALCNLAHLARARGDLQRARTLYYQEIMARDSSHTSVLGTVYVLEGLAGVASAQGQLELAARLWGSAASLREAHQVAPPPLAVAQQERDMAAARTALGAKAFMSAWAAGWDLSAQQAIAGALDEA
jgi:predicted ATPase